MLKGLKTEAILTTEQVNKFNESINICRYLYNKFIETNVNQFKLYKLGLVTKNYISGYEYAKYINNVVSRTKTWIKNCPSKARKEVIMNAEKAYKRFFKIQKTDKKYTNNKYKKIKRGYKPTIYDLNGFPKFKKKNEDKISLYFPKNDKNKIIEFTRDRVFVPTFSETKRKTKSNRHRKGIRLKEYNKIPKNAIIKSCYLSRKNKKYYLSVLIEVNNNNVTTNNIQHNISEGQGLDLGVKTYVTSSNGNTYKNINKSKKIKKMQKRKKRLQKALARKIENYKNNKNTRKNIEKNKLQIAKLEERITNIRNHNQAEIISNICKQHPQFITIEDLNIKGMMKNKHLSKAIGECKFYQFKQKLITACHKYNIELREVNRYYPSSKKCCKCGNKKEDLKLKDRIYKCEKCGNKIDRDLNASINLQQAKEYTIL